jgi:hypothetical protein
MKGGNSFYISIFAAAFAIASCSGTRRASSPILLLGTQSDFGLYTAEILKTEGFNDFETDSLSGARVTEKYLKGYDLVILAETSVEASGQEILSEYVKDGGNLIAFRPDKKLSALFGVSDAKGKVSEGYLAVDANSEPGRGITTETLQFHGEADQYHISGGRAIAHLFENESTRTDFPAVVQHEYGNGKAIAFTYNLPESIVLTRQGNYEHAAEEMDGILGIRAMDLFTDGWVDPSKNTVNQADEQMRLLSHCIENLMAGKRPVPRFWYFPDTLRCVVTLNNDGEDSKEREFTPQFQDVDAKGAKMTLYIKEVRFVSKAWVDTWTKKGFEISGHPNDTRQAKNPDWKTMDSVYTTLINELNTNYGIPSMQTVTNHWFVWVGRNAAGEKDFTAQAKIEEKHGVGLDCNYAHYDNGSSHGHFLGEFGTNQGNYTGSGLAMKFADANGKIINVYQQLNNVYDQQYMEHKDQDGYFNAFKGLMDRSLDREVYSTISVRAHNNEYFFSKVPLMKALDYAVARGVPVWTELQLLEFVKAKDEATFSDLTWSDNTMRFNINSTIKIDHGLTCLLPLLYEGKKVDKVITNGNEQTYSVKSMKGFQYVWVTVTPGSNYRIEVHYK